MSLRRKMRNFIAILAIGILSVLYSSEVFAQDINANEASVISAASGTFEYNGKTYQAYSIYISMLKEKFASDGVDLTAEQASEAILEIYANIDQGIEDGYLYEVDSKTDSSDDAESDSSVESDSKSQWADSALDQDGTVNEASYDNIEEDTAVTEDETVNDNETENEDETVTEATDNDSEEDTKEDSEEVTDYQLTIDEDSSEIDSSFNLNFIKITGYIFIGISALITIVLIIISFLLKKKRNARVGIRLIANICMIFDVVVFIFFVGIFSGMANNSSVYKIAANTDYTNSIYEEYKAEESELLIPLGYSEDVLDNVTTYKRMQVLTKSNIQLVAEGKNPSESDAFEISEEIITALSYEQPEILTDSDLEILAMSLGSRFSELSNFSIGNVFLGIRDSLKTSAGVMAVVLLLIMCGKGFVILFNHRRRHRALRGILLATLTGTFIYLVTIGVLYIINPFENINVTQEYYDDLITAYGTWFINILAVTGAIALLLIVISSIITKKLVKRRKNG